MHCQRNPVRLGEATVLLAGASALVRQSLRSETVGTPAMAACVIQHVKLVPEADGCAASAAPR